MWYHLNDGMRAILEKLDTFPWGESLNEILYQNPNALIEKSYKKCNRNGHKVVKWWRRESGGGREVSYGLQTCLPPSQEIEFYTVQRNTFYSGGQNPCLTYWEIGGNVCPVNIGDGGGAAMGEIQAGDPTARIALFLTDPNVNALFSKSQSI